MKLFKKMVLFLGAIIAGFILFTVFNMAWDYATHDPKEDLSLEVCPEESVEAVFDYYREVDKLFQTPYVAVTHEEAAQIYNSLQIQAEELSYPDCAAIHNEFLALSLEYRSYAEAALAEGGLFNKIRAEYYTMVAKDYSFLIPFITYRILPDYNPNSNQPQA